MADKYQEDEFDRIAQSRALSGGHRQEKKSHKWFIALIAVIICAPILGIGIGYGLSAVRTGLTENERHAAAQQIEKAQQEEKKKAAEEEAAVQEKAQIEAEEKAKAEAEAAVKYDTAVSVLNGTDISGFAAENAQKLIDTGFTAVDTGDYVQEQPAESIVYYADPTLKATAEKTAEILGISSVEENAEAVSSEQPIVVILRSQMV